MSTDQTPENEIQPIVEGDNDVDNKTSVHVAIQAYDYEIERGASVLPARRRIIPIKFRDFQDPDEIDYDNKDKDFVPSSSGPSLVKIPRLPRTGGKRGRPRKIPRDHAYANGKEDGQTITGDSGASDIKSADIKTGIPSSPNERPSETDEEAQEREAPDDQNEKPSVSNSFDPETLIKARPYKCDCGLSFQRLASLKKHKWLAHQDNNEESNVKKEVKAEKADMPRPFKCNMCEKRFGQKGNLKVHLRTHTGEKPFKCDMEKCGKSFRSNESLRRHKLAHLGIKLYECSICANKFSSNVALKEHMSRHTDCRPYECQICHKMFRQVSCYKRHLVTHSSELPYKCDICGKGFSQTIYLKSHLRSHTGERPYTCEICGKSFAHASDKTRHKTVHTGEKKYACNVCGSHFSDPSTCRRHVREHTGHKPYPCQLCGDAFKRSGQLKAHLNNKHMHFKEDMLLDKTSNKVTTVQFADGKFTTLHGFQDDGHSQPTIIVNNEMLEERTEVITQIIQEQLQNKSSQSTTEQVQVIQQGQSLLKVSGKHATVTPSNSQTNSKEEHLMVDTQQILEQIQSQLDPSQAQLINEDGMPVEVAYQIIHDDENQQIVEIQYHPLTASMEISEQDVSQQQSMDVIENVGGSTEQSESALTPNQSSEGENQHESVSVLTLNHSLDSASAADKEIVNEGIPNENSSTEHSALESYEVSEVVENEATEKNASFKTLSSDVTLEYVANPDFNSQEYYNWLSSFTEVCKQVIIPLNLELFQRISQVHKTLSDVLATPKGVLSNKDNFKILMSISKDLNEIISQHLNHVLLSLDEKTE